MTLTATQKAFAVSRAPFPAFVGGYGSGKSAAAIARALALKFHFPECDIAYYLPTYPLIEDIAYRRFPDLCERKEWAYRLNRSSAYIDFPGAGRIVFRTMERPERIVGYEVAHSICDELDTLPLNKARDVWNRVIARNRQKLPGGFPNTVAVATTPEGFGFVYERWARSPKPGYVLFRARTMDNAEHLPAGYIDNLRNTYGSAQLAAYLDGEFVNMQAGSVYPDFDRRLNASSETIQSDEALHIGADFNVTKMAAVVYVLRNDAPHAVAELVDMFDTPAMVATIKAKFPGHSILMYPDASGGSRKSNDASVSDISLLRSAGFRVLAHAKNPAVKDRVLATNKLIRERMLRVNTDACPVFTEALEKQAYDKNGEPDKASGFDHIVDAGTYPLAYRWPIQQRIAQVQPLRI